MPLDPQIKPIVDAVEGAAAAGPPASELSVEERRAGYLALADFAGGGPPLDEVIDLAIPGPAGDIPVRVYRNAGAQGIFVFYHGGGYTIGDLDSHDQVCRQLALESGSTVMAVHYRLAPENPFPAGIDDAWTALQWADANKTELGGAADAKIVVGGDSAGGNFSAVMALMARDAGLDLAAQLLVYPGVEIDDDSPSMTENGSGYVLTEETMIWFRECYAADAADWRASPIRAGSHAGVAPAVVITAEFDPIRDQGAAYAAKLEAAGVDVTHTNYEGMVHIFFQLGPIVGAGARAVTQVAEAAKKALS
ncbi:MAG: alpha/beta hydrolase [Actinomycetia bacterium]|nr:alpha/beta hydrolase [Actinomycetes bacterium]